MRDDWREVALGEIFQVTNDRLGVHTAEPTVFSVTKYAGLVRAEDYFGKRVASAQLDTYKVLHADDWAYSTIHIDEGSIARNRLSEWGVVSPMYTTMRIKSAEALPFFCELVLRSPMMLETFRRMQQGSVNRRRSLPWNTFASIRIRLPQLSEQERIVDLFTGLDKTVEIARKAAAHLLQASNVLRAALPEAEYVPLGEILTAIESGTSTKPIEGAGPRRRMLTLAAIRPARFNPKETKDVGIAPLPDRARLHDGDLLITRSNTPDRVGHVAIARGVEDRTYLPDLVWRLVPNPRLAAGDYLAQVLSSAPLRAEITASASGTSQSMRKINKTNFKKIRVPLPALQRQAEYVAPLARAGDAYAAAVRHLDQLCDLRSRLLKVVLSGDHEIPESYDQLLAD